MQFVSGWPHDTASAAPSTPVYMSSYQDGMPPMLEHSVGHATGAGNSGPWHNSSHPDFPVEGQRFIRVPPLWQHEDGHGSGQNAGVPRWLPLHTAFVRPDTPSPSMGKWTTSQGFHASFTPYAQSFHAAMPQGYWCLPYPHVGDERRGPTHGGSPYFPTFSDPVTTAASLPAIPSILTGDLQGSGYAPPPSGYQYDKDGRQGAGCGRLSAKRAIESEKKSQFPQAEDPRPFKRDRRESEDAFTVPPPAFHKFNTVYIAPDGLHDATTMEAGTGRHVSNDKVPFTRSDEEDCDLPCLPGIRVSRNIAHDKIYRCGMTGCDVTFTSVTNAAEHMQSAHDVPRPFLCRVEGCCANFASKAVLSMHARVHSGEKPFKCTHKGCNAAFGQKSNLKRHMLVHTGARPFVCSFEGCGAAFAQKTTLVYHVRTHTKEKPFKCAEPGCDAEFALRSGLTVHARTHSGERPYTCDAPGCTASFQTKSHLSRHVASHTKPH